MFKRLLLTCALLATPLAAQSAPSPNLAGIAHIALRVKDLDASIVFYQKLGFVKAFDLSRDGKVYEAFIKINDRQFIELYPVDAKNPQVGFLHVCFEANDIQSVHDFYIAQGLKPIDVRKAGAGNLLFTMPGPMTPQGAQNMEYTQYMPGSLHSNDFGKHLGPERFSSELVGVGIAVDDPKAAKDFYVAKAGFIPDAKDQTGRNVDLPPGTSGQHIDLMPEKKTDPHARLYFAGDIDQGERALKAQDVMALKKFGSLVMIDPDANTIVIEPVRVSH